MQTILTSKGQRILVDDDDFEWLSRHTWHVSAWGYAETNFWDPATGKSRTARMHRMIFGLKPGDRDQVDHINGDRLDNRRSVNLRRCTAAENALNRKQYAVSTSGLKGVSLHKASGLWTATVNVNGKRQHLSYHRTKEDAYAKYCEIASRLHGSFFNPGVIGVEGRVD